MDLNRRRLLQTGGIVLATGLAGCGGDGGSTESGGYGGGGSTESGGSMETTEGGTSGMDTVSVVIDNVGASAWVKEQGPVGPSDVENFPLTLQTGVRYVVENRGWDAHPFAIKTKEDEALLSQATEGSMEGSSEVDWRDDGAEFAFTWTQDLMSQAHYYTCTVHPDMRGLVREA